MTKLERFSAGESFAVDPDAIERELASLWREAGRTTEQGGHPVTRACLWNVVLHLEERAEHEGYPQASQLEAMVASLPRHLAARALVLRTRPDAEGKPALESWISANCILAGGGGKLVCSEEITLAARGEAERRLPSLVRALLVPAVPTAVLFSGLPDLSRPALKSLVELADRVVTDVERSRFDAPLSKLRASLSNTALYGMDLGWHRMAGLRSAIAGLFDPPSPVHDLQRISAVRLRCPQAHAGALLLAWIASSLSASEPVSSAPGTWELQREGAPLSLSLSASDDGSTSLEFAVDEQVPLWVRISPQGCMETPDLGQKEGAQRRQLTAPQEVELLARALATRSDDQPFSRAVNLAEALCA